MSFPEIGRQGDPRPVSERFDELLRSGDLDAAARVAAEDRMTTEEIDEIGIRLVSSVIYGDLEHANEIASHHVWGQNLMTSSEVAHEARKLKKLAEGRGDDAYVDRISELCNV